MALVAAIASWIAWIKNKEVTISWEARVQAERTLAQVLADTNKSNQAIASAMENRTRVEEAQVRTQEATTRAMENLSRDVTELQKFAESAVRAGEESRRQIAEIARRLEVIETRLGYRRSGG